MIRDYRAPKKRLRRKIEKLRATPFQKGVWKALLEIPRGEVRTYGWLARRIGRPGACRAVGNALGKNPLAPEVPCHRIVSAKGIGGYSGEGGVSKKRQLLAREGVKGSGVS